MPAAVAWWWDSMTGSVFVQDVWCVAVKRMSELVGTRQRVYQWNIHDLFRRKKRQLWIAQSKQRCPGRWAQIKF
jgi:hypothetical protein